MVKYSQTVNQNVKYLLIDSLYIKILFAVAFCGILTAGTTTTASPCYPNDPDGTNPGNLCLTYPPSWSPLPNTSTDQPPIVQAVGQAHFEKGNSSSIFSNCSAASL
jgi:hypothetical protein